MTSRLCSLRTMNMLFMFLLSSEMYPVPESRVGQEFIPLSSVKCHITH